MPRLDKRARIFHRRLLQDSVAQIQDVADAAGFFDGVARPRGGRLLPDRAERTGPRCLAARCPVPTSSRTVARSTRQSTLNTFAPDSAAAAKQWLDAFVYRITGVSPAPISSISKLRGGQREFAILLERQFADPGVE